MSCFVFVFPVCTLCIDNADCDGWVLSALWRMVAFRKTSSMASWRWGGEQPAALTYDIIDVCVRDMKAVDIDTMSWEGLSADRTKWRSALKQHLKTGEDKLVTAAADKRARGMEGSSSIRPETTHRCVICDKDCHLHIGLFSQNVAAITQREINKIKNKNKTNTLGCIIHGHL